jgi:hypothetical protein
MNDDVLVLPAKSLKEMLPQLLPVWLPDGLRDGFFSTAKIWRQKPADEWTAEWDRRQQPMQALVDKLAGWMNIEDWELPLSACEDTLLLFHVLRLQSMVIRVLHLSDDQFVPGELDQLWHWLLDLRQGEHWIIHTVFARDGLRQLPPQAWMWAIVTPAEFASGG